MVSLTTAPNAAFAPIHNRMPAMIDPSHGSEWVDGSPDQLIGPLPEGSVATVAI